MSVLIARRGVLAASQRDAAPGPTPPPDFPVEGLEPWAWFAADQESYADSDPVTTWRNLSDDTNDATQGSSSRQPTFRTGQVNGLPAIEFSSDRLDTSTSISLRPATAFAVVNCASAGNRTIVGATDGGSNAGSLQWRTFSSKQDLLREGTALIGTSDSNVSFSQWQLWDVRWSSSGHQFGLQGANDGSGSAGGSPSSRVVRIGARAGSSILDPWLGMIAELVIFNEALSDTDRGDVRTYLMGKYDL